MKLVSCFAFLLAVMFARTGAAAPALWLVEDTAGEGRAYLFGSVHFGVQSLYPLPEEVLLAFKHCDALAVEIDLSLISPQAASRAVQRYGYYPNGSRLDDLLRGDDWQHLDMVLNDLGEARERYQRMKPWLVAMQLTALQINQRGYRKELGLDHYFLQLARQGGTGKRIIELESLDQQLSLFNQLSSQQQMTFLRQVLTGYHKAPGMLKKIIDAWRTGDEADLEQQLLANLAGQDELLHYYLYTRRNQQMAERLTGYLESGRNLFVVVGAGHLLGEGGLKSLLVERGYRLTRISSPGTLYTSNGGVEPRS